MLASTLFCCSDVCESGQEYNVSNGDCKPCNVGYWNTGNASQRFELCSPCPEGYLTENEMTGADSVLNCTLSRFPCCTRYMS